MLEEDMFCSVACAADIKSSKAQLMHLISVCIIVLHARVKQILVSTLTGPGHLLSGLN